MSSPLRGPLVLPEDVVLSPAAELSEELRQQVGGQQGDFAISRLRSRGTSQLIDAEAAALLEYFRTGRTIVKAVALFSRERGLDPEGVLEQALPLLQQLVSSRLLVPEASPDSDAIVARLTPGERFGALTVGRCLQVLEDSELYQARDRGGRYVVLKMARPGHTQAVLPRLQREAAALNRLDGAASPRLIDFQPAADPPFLALSWCPGIDVTRAAAEARAHGDRRALQPLLSKTVNAYGALHRRGIVHGDVHPGNVLIDRDGAVALLDFGLSNLADLPVAERGGVSFFYEPEWALAVLAGGRLPPATPLGEQYGVAALLYLLATGHHHTEFQLDNETMVRQIAEEPPRSFNSVGAESWPALESVLARALAKNPDERYQDMGIFAAALAAVEVPSSSRSPAPASGRSARLVTELLIDLDPEASLFRQGLPAGPVCSVNLGAGGIAYAHYRLACARDDSELLARAEIWTQRALRDRDRKDAFVNPELELTEEVAGRVSPYHSLAGVQLVRALIARATGDLNELSEALDGFVQASGEPCAQWDLVLGRCGTVLGCALLLEADLAPAGGQVEPLRQLGTVRLEDIWKGVSGFGPLAECTELPNLGIAHGWAGLLYTTLRWHESAGEPLPAAFGERLAQLIESAFPLGRGLAISWRERPSEHDRTMAGWCNGSAGLVQLGCLAHRILGDEASLALAEGAAWNAWEDDNGLIDLCCGLSGRAYALLAMHELSGELAWLDRARRLGRRAAGLAPDQRGPQHPRHSLYKGELGLAVLLAELDRHQPPGMPLFAPER